MGREGLEPSSAGGPREHDPPPRENDDVEATELTKFLGPVEDRDAEVIERWRDASAEAHAEAMIELSRYAERMAAQTGLGKDPAERFPGIPEPLPPSR